MRVSVGTTPPLGGMGHVSFIVRASADLVSGECPSHCYATSTVCRLVKRQENVLPACVGTVGYWDAFLGVCLESQNMGYIAELLGSKGRKLLNYRPDHPGVGGGASHNLRAVVHSPTTSPRFTKWTATIA